MSEPLKDAVIRENGGTDEAAVRTEVALRSQVEADEHAPSISGAASAGAGDRPVRRDAASVVPDAATSTGVPPTMLYGAMVGYLHANGWRREERGSGWWWHEKFDEVTIGDAVQQQLEADGLDTREMVLLEPEDFYG